MLHNAFDSQPELVGTLTPGQARIFSQPFEHDWGYVDNRGLLVGCEAIRLLDPSIEDNIFGVPRGYEQFLPAIAIAVEHEQRARHPSLILSEALLTIRQGEVRPGWSQQGPTVESLHRDIDGKSGLGRLYTLSDFYPTQYFPQIASTPETPGSILISDADKQGCVEFSPYDIVHASAMVYHRSPQIPEGGMRTFMRLAFNYKQ